MSFRPRKIFFSPHENYETLFKEGVGVEWIEACMQAYLRPSAGVVEIANDFVARYRLKQVPTMSVCYRGTDKKVEISPTPLQVYFRYVDEWLNGLPDREVLIQTDQFQVRELFVARYGKRCKYIEEMPVTKGDTVMHRLPEIDGRSSWFSRQLLAMWIAIGETDTLVTHTGNVGLFLAMRMIINGKKVVQLN